MKEKLGQSFEVLPIAFVILLLAIIWLISFSEAGGGDHKSMISKLRKREQKLAEKERKLKSIHH